MIPSAQSTLAPLEIQDLAYPPKLAADELVDCPENEKYYKLWPTQEKNSAVSRRSADMAQTDVNTLAYDRSGENWQLRSAVGEYVGAHGQGARLRYPPRWPPERAARTC